MNDNAQMTYTMPLPHLPEDLTPSWLSTVLQQHHDVSVAAATVTPIGTGQMASSLRVSLDYERHTSAAPKSVVVKIASNDPNSRAAGERGAYLREVRFYQELAESLAVATPRSYFAAIDIETNDFAIVLEDMHPAEQGDQIAGCDGAAVIDAARNIAGLHAPTWGDESLNDAAWLVPPADQQAQRRVELKELVQMMTPGFIDRYDGRLEPVHIELLQWFAETVDDWAADNRGTFSLMHGDHRLDNLLFNSSDAERPVTVVDWQTLSVRNPLADLAYLLGTCVDTPLRREIEHEAIAAYHEQLTALGVADYSLERCTDDYRTQSPHSLLLCVLGSMLTVQTDRGDDMFMAMLHRSTQQIIDLDVR